MADRTVRISEKSWDSLCGLAEEMGESQELVLERAIEHYRRQQLLEQTNIAYAALRADPEAWADWQRELALWDCTLMDGLDPDEIWHPDGTVTDRDAAETTDSDDPRRN